MGYFDMSIPIEPIQPPNFPPPVCLVCGKPYDNDGANNFVSSETGVGPGRQYLCNQCLWAGWVRAARNAYAMSHETGSTGPTGTLGDGIKPEAT